MKKTLTFLLTAILGLCTLSGCGKDAASLYALNGKDLKDIAFARLPTGTIEAKGHLYDKLKAQGDNITSDMIELDRDLKNHVWFGGTKTFPSAAYYLRGYAMTAYTLNDKPMIQRLEELLSYTYSSAEEHNKSANTKDHGLIGPEWSKSPSWIDKQEVCAALQVKYEATRDAKTLTVLENYNKWLLNDLSSKSFPADWEASRAVDVFDSAVWLYNYTSNESVKKDTIKVMEKIMTDCSSDWLEMNNKNTYSHGTFFDRHIVNVMQGFKAPIVFSQLTGDKEEVDSFYNGLNNLSRDHGRIDGLINGTEQLSGLSSIEAVETCAVVEMIASLDRAMQITQDAKLGDRLERVGYNAMPGATSVDMKSISYFSPTNLPQLTWGTGGAGYSDQYYDGNPGYVTDAPDDLGGGPHPACHCCNVNVHMGYPEFINSMYYYTADRGIAVALYGPSKATIQVGKGNVPVTIEQSTNYPFEDTINISLNMKENLKFPLKLRVPGWEGNVSITVNGDVVKNIKKGEFVSIERKWSSSDKIEVKIVPDITRSEWVNNSVGVERGALAFSLEIGEEHIRMNNSNPGVGLNNKQYYDYNIKPTTDWNYGLVLDNANFAENFEVVRKEITSTTNVYEKSQAPLKLKAKAKKIDEWTINDNKILAEEPPVSPVVSNNPTVNINLVPYGTGKLRIANIPFIGSTGAKAQTVDYTNDWKKNELNDFVFYGPAWKIDIKSKVFSTFNNDKRNAWGHSAFNPKAILNNKLYKDFTLETIYEPMGANVNNFGVIFRASDISHSRAGFSGYYAAINLNINKATLYKVVNNKPSIVKQQSISGELIAVEGIAYKLVVSNNSIKLFVNGEQVISATDSTYTQAGLLGFVVHSDDFMIAKNAMDAPKAPSGLGLACAMKELKIKV